MLSRWSLRLLGFFFGGIPWVFGWRGEGADGGGFGGVDAALKCGFAFGYLLLLWMRFWRFEGAGAVARCQSNLSTYVLVPTNILAFCPRTHS
jgi:hypothetical protein